ncbi:hypothetical protein R6Q59_014820 [Mikania micrantha]
MDSFFFLLLPFFCWSLGSVFWWVVLKCSLWFDAPRSYFVYSSGLDLGCSKGGLGCLRLEQFGVNFCIFWLGLGCGVGCSAIWVFSDMYRGWVYLSWKGSDAKLVLGWAVKTWSISSFGVFLVQHKGDWACGTTSLLGYFGGRCTRWARVKGLLMPAAGLVLLWNVFPYLGWGLLAAMRGFCGSVVDAYGSWVVLVTPKTPKHHAVSVSGLGWIASWSGPLFWLISGCFRDWAQRWIGIYLAYWASKMGPGRGSSCLCCSL